MHELVNAAVGGALVATAWVTVPVAPPLSVTVSVTVCDPPLV